MILNTKPYLLVLLCFISLTMLSCNDNNPVEENTSNQNTTTPNVLLIVADDLGMDATTYATQLNTTKPTMPNLDKLITNGVRFTNAWAYPTCTPTRGSIITGKHGVQTGLTAPGDHIDISETTLQSYINTNGSTKYASAVFGKWHLSRNSNDIESMGIDMYKGSISGGVNNYYDWTLEEDGNTFDIENYYTTTAYTDYAIDWIKEQNTPWFCWVAYNAAHTPFHTPKDSSLFTHTGTEDLDMYLQMLEAMDAEIGRLTDNIPEDVLANTTIIFVGDNGTPSQVAQLPFGRGNAKGSLFNGGVNVPLVVSGANVSRQNESDDALVQTTDLFATIADLCNVNVSSVNESISFKTLLTKTATSPRNFSYVESPGNGPNFGGYAVRNSEYKYLYDEDNNEEFLYKVFDDYEEVNDLLLNDDLTEIEQQNMTELLNEANRIQDL